MTSPTSTCWLVYEQALPLRNPPACPATVERSFLMGPKRILACGDRTSGVSRSSAPLNRPSRPNVRPPLGCALVAMLGNLRGDVGRAGLHWTVEVAPGRETPSHPTASGGKLSLPRPIENAAANVAGPARGFRGGNAFWYTSRRSRVGAEIGTDKNILPSNSEPSPVLCVAGEACAGCLRGSISSHLSATKPSASPTIPRS
jgi:hypothetical protein